MHSGKPLYAWSSPLSGLCWFFWESYCNWQTAVGNTVRSHSPKFPMARRSSQVIVSNRYSGAWASSVLPSAYVMSISADDATVVTGSAWPSEKETDQAASLLIDSGMHKLSRFYFVLFYLLMTVIIVADPLLPYNQTILTIVCWHWGASCHNWNGSQA